MSFPLSFSEGSALTPVNIGSSGSQTITSGDRFIAARSKSSPLGTAAMTLNSQPSIRTRRLRMGSLEWATRIWADCRVRRLLGARKLGCGRYQSGNQHVVAPEQQGRDCTVKFRMREGEDLPDWSANRPFEVVLHFSGNPVYRDLSPRRMRRRPISLRVQFSTVGAQAEGRFARARPETQVMFGFDAYPSLRISLLKASRSSAKSSEIRRGSTSATMIWPTSV